ncbi:MAG: hypothetical protein ACP5P9_07605 [Acidimicrobiales bacterium]
MSVPATAATRGRPTVSGKRQVVAGTSVVFVYGLLGLLAHWPLLPGDPSRVYMSCDCGDMAQAVWFLAWTPHAVLSGHNPFFTTAMNYPVGVNLAQNTLMPLLGILAAPVTATLGPVASANLWMILAMPLSATSAYLVLRHWRLEVPAAALGGLFFGFSPYLTGQGIGHLDLVFVALVPLIVLVLVDLAKAPAHPLRLGVVLGLLVVAQFLVSPEVLVTSLVLCAVGVLVAGIRQAVRDRATLVRQATPMVLGLAVAALIAGVLVAYPAWFELAGPHHFVGPAQGPHNPYRADLFDFVVPSPYQWLAPGGLRAWGLRLTHLVGIEDGAYLGVPVLLLAAWIAWRSRAATRTQLAVVVGLAAAVLSLGAHLVVDGHATGIPLPFLLIAHLPGLASILPIRISFETDAALAAVFAFGVDDQWRRARARGLGGSGVPVGGQRARAGHARRRRARTQGAWFFTVGVLAVAGLTLAPRWPDANSPAARAPAALARLAPVDRAPVVLTYPFAIYPQDQALAWQAAAGFDFRLIGSYALVQSPTGAAMAHPSTLAPADVEAFLDAMEGAQPIIDGPVPLLDANLVRDTRTFFHRYHVRLVVVDRRTQHAAVVEQLFTRALGRPPRRGGSFDVWEIGGHAHASLSSVAR